MWKTGLPVRSAVLKPHAGELVVGWVTTSESSLLYVFVFYIFLLTVWTVGTGWSLEICLQCGDIHVAVALILELLNVVCVELGAVYRPI